MKRDFVPNQCRRAVNRGFARSVKRLAEERSAAALHPRDHSVSLQGNHIVSDNGEIIL